MSFRERRAVFFDRDGVINRAIIVDGKPKSPKLINELFIYNEAIELIKMVRNLDLVPIIITNQPEIARGNITLDQANAINDYILRVTQVERVYMCPHDDADSCQCRKPKPGLLKEASKELGINLKTSYCIGDRWRDIEAGLSVGTKTIWIDRGYIEPEPNYFDLKISSLKEAGDFIRNSNKQDSM